VLSGISHGVAGAISRPVTEPLCLDLHLPEGVRFAQKLPPECNAFLYVYRGEVSIEGQSVEERRMAIFAEAGDADGVILQAVRPCRALLIAGRPLNEPIVQYGPFVMNAQEEIAQAVQDYKSGRFAVEA
jgi:redox-sensitive bicupin YhaK (pirin superfamily)